MWSLIPADCTARDLVGTISQGAIIFPRLQAQGWVAQRIDSKEQSFLYICQLNPCPRQQGSNVHPWVFRTVAVLDPGAPAAGKRVLLRLPRLVPALYLHPRGVGEGGYTALSFIRAKGQLGHGFGRLSPKVLPPIRLAGATAEMLLLPAPVHPDSRGSPKLSAKAGSSKGQGDAGLQSQDGDSQTRPAEDPGCETPAPAHRPPNPTAADLRAAAQPELTAPAGDAGSKSTTDFGAGWTLLKKHKEEAKSELSPHGRGTCTKNISSALPLPGPEN